MNSPYDETKPLRYKLVSYWSGMVLEKGRVFDDSDEAWRVAHELNLEISIDAIVVADDEKGTEPMQQFYPVLRPAVSK